MLTKKELRGTHLIYSESISEEILHKIYNKLESLGFKKNIHCEIQHSFVDFINNGFLRVDHLDSYCIDNNSNGCYKEIQVSDIIGTQFEVGKWYKLNNWISKFDHLENENRFWGYNINTDTKFIDPRGWLRLEGCVPILISLEEIQQYLPANHVDKVVKSPSVEEVKSVEEWGNNTWVVCIKEYASYFKVGDVAQIKVTNAYGLTEDCVDICDYIGIPCYPFKSHCKWFATKEEAELFSRALLEPTKMKEYVNVTTQEEWDFVTEKLGYDWEYGRWDVYKSESYIILTRNLYGSIARFNKDDYYTFQEWCSLNKYTFPETEEFKVGDYVVVTKQNVSSNYAQVGHIGELLFISSDKSYFFVDHPEMKDSGGSTCHGVRKALQEEIKAVTKVSTPESKEFVLPERWCVLTTPSNIGIIGAFYNKQSGSGCYTTFDSSEPYLVSHHLASDKSIIAGNVNGSNFKISKPSDLYPEITFEQFNKHVLNKTEVKKEYDLSTTITRAVKGDNPNLIFEEFGVTEITGLKSISCILADSNIRKIEGNFCRQLSCNGDNCPFHGYSDKTIETATAWLYRDRSKSIITGGGIIVSDKDKYSIAEVPVRITVRKSVKPKVRNTPSIEKVTNRLKASPTIKRSLPEIY